MTCWKAEARGLLAWAWSGTWVCRATRGGSLGIDGWSGMSWATKAGVDRSFGDQVGVVAGARSVRPGKQGMGRGRAAGGII